MSHRLLVCLAAIAAIISSASLTAQPFTPEALTNRPLGYGNDASAVYWNPGVLDAVNGLTGTRTPFNQQQMGGVVSGPIVKDRTHFIASYEGTNQDSELVVTSVFKPGAFPATLMEGGVLPWTCATVRTLATSVTLLPSLATNVTL